MELEQDAAGYINGLNDYEFVLDNPIDGTDPTGMEDQTGMEGLTGLPALYSHGADFGGNNGVQNFNNNMAWYQQQASNAATSAGQHARAFTRATAQNLTFGLYKDPCPDPKAQIPAMLAGLVAGEGAGNIAGKVLGASIKAIRGLASGERALAAGEAANAAGKGCRVVDEGIYEFPSSSGKPYVGQSGNIPGRLEQHLDTGKLLASDVGDVQTTEVLGGKTAREIAEQQRINQLGGVQNLENVRNPIGPARQHLMPSPPELPPNL